VAADPAVSVVVPMLNCADTIGALLDSLAAQTYTGAWEVVVADNGSTDASVATVRAWEDRLPGLRIVSSIEGRGSSYALNAGTRATSAPLVAYCHADDVVSPVWLEAVVADLQHHDMTTGPIDLALLNAPETYRWRGSTGWDHLPGWHRYLPAALGCNLGVRRDVFDRVDGFDGTMKHCGDLDFEWRAQLAGATFGFAPLAVVHWRVRNSPLAFFRAHLAYGESDVHLFARFRSEGMPRRVWSGVVRLGLLVPSSPLLLLRSQRYRWLAGAGSAVGHVLGSWRDRVLYL
jgi:glycosyltransferase involved in cell wall biosynthesis